MAFDIGELVLKHTLEMDELYIGRVYDVFRADFVDDKPSFHKRFALKRYPLCKDNKEATFWHLTTFGEVENERQIDISRCERIRYPKNIIENFRDKDVKYWTNQRKGNKNILLYFEKENYLVVLSDRGEYVLLWTAYVVTYDNQKRKLLKEYNEYKNNAGDAIFG